MAEYKEGITLITPTGDRQLAFERCEYYINRQTVKPDQWIISDDSSSDPTRPILSFRQSLNQEIYTRPYSPNQKKSFTGNILNCLAHIKYDKIFVIEDDDWVHPRYIERSLERIRDFDLIGQPYAIYYNIAQQRWRKNMNDKRASFCETVFRSNCIPIVQEACAVRNSAFVDAKLWRHPTPTKRLFGDERLVVGLKGLPGRSGIGIGHRCGPSYKYDPKWKKLKELIGKEDAQFYIDLKKRGIIK